MFLQNRSVGFSTRSCPVKHEVPSGETEVEETVFLWKGPRFFSLEKQGFFDHREQHLNPVVGSSSPEVTTASFPFEV